MHTILINPIMRLPETSGRSIPGRVGTCYLILLFLLSLLASCSCKKNQPEGVLSKDEMAEVMIDFYLKDSRINTLQLQPDSALALFQYYRMEYAEEKNIPDSVIEKSYQYYVTNPVEFGEVYDRVIDSLVLREQRTRAKPD